MMVVGIEPRGRFIRLKWYVRHAFGRDGERKTNIMGGIFCRHRLSDLTVAQQPQKGALTYAAKGWEMTENAEDAKFINSCESLALPAKSDVGE